MTAAIDAPAAGRTSAGLGRLAGTGQLIRFILRRDRVRLPVWLGGFTLFMVVCAAAFPDVYPTAVERQARAALMANPGTAALSGPGYGIDDYTIGAMLTNEVLGWLAIFVALMSILLMVRHTRAEEETGRAELVRAAVVGRYAHLTAAVTVVGGACLLLGVLVAVSLGLLGVESVSWAGSWMFGAALTSVGLVFVGVTAVTTQFAQHARSAGGLAGVVFGGAYLLRAAGDMSTVGRDGEMSLSWLSPVGWAQQTRPYVDERWWPLLLSLALTGGLLALAFQVSARRDVGAGIVTPRAGASAASTRLRGVFSLAGRMHRASFGWWALVLLLGSAGYGSIVSEVEAFIADNAGLQEWLTTIGGKDILIDSFLAMIMLIWAAVVTIFAVLVVQRARTEELAGRAEPVLATAVSRVRWVASHLVTALVGGTALLALSGLGLGVGAAAALDDWDLVPKLVGAGLAYAPAVWLTVAVAVALFGLLPRAMALVWVVVGYAALISSLGGLLGLPDWTFRLSPFEHVPALPAADFTMTPLVVLTAIAVGLMTVGLVGFRRRDVEAS